MEEEGVWNKAVETEPTCGVYYFVFLLTSFFVSHSDSEISTLNNITFNSMHFIFGELKKHGQVSLILIRKGFHKNPGYIFSLIESHPIFQNSFICRSKPSKSIFVCNHRLLFPFSFEDEVHARFRVSYSSSL